MAACDPHPHRGWPQRGTTAIPVTTSATSLTHHPRYIEHQGGKPAGYGVIPASVIDEIIVMLESTPELGLMGCIRKYKEETGCTFHEQAIAGKYRRLTKAMP